MATARVKRGKEDGEAIVGVDLVASGCNAHEVAEEMSGGDHLALPCVRRGVERALSASIGTPN